MEFHLSYISCALGFTVHTSAVYQIYMPPSQLLFCSLTETALFTSVMCSCYFILSMTFDRFYSIIRPHKAASFNTVKRAKITIVCVIVLSVLYNTPFFFLIGHQGTRCIPYGRNMGYTVAQFYYWLSFSVNFIFPFSALLIMNSFIIHTLRNRVSVTNKGPLNVGQRGKTSETQVFVILLLVTFCFLILTTPSIVFHVYNMLVDEYKSPKDYATFYILLNVGQKAFYTNNGINFFLYVLSGGKFRTDLLRLFKYKKENQESVLCTRSESSSYVSKRSEQ